MTSRNHACGASADLAFAERTEQSWATRGLELKGASPGCPQSAAPAALVWGLQNHQIFSQDLLALPSVSQKGHEMSNKTRTPAIAVGIASVLTIGTAGQSLAGSLPLDAVVRPATIEAVRYQHHPRRRIVAMPLQGFSREDYRQDGVAGQYWTYPYPGWSWHHRMQFLQH